jgi:hypothetical protein
MLAADASFAALISITKVSPQSKARANCNAENPKAPNPKIATDSPDLRRALFKAYGAVADQHIMIAPTSNGISSGSGKRIRARNFDEFRIAAIAVFTDHLSVAAKLFYTARAKIAAPAMNQIVYTDSIGRCHVRDICAHSFQRARRLHTPTKRANCRGAIAGAVMRVRVTDSSSRNPNQNILYFATRWHRRET